MFPSYRKKFHRLGGLRVLSHARLPEVFHCETWGQHWDDTVVQDLKVVAQGSQRKRARLCMHPSPSETHQEMLIVMHREAIELPQRRISGFDTKIVLEGSALMRFFSDSGFVTGQILLSELDTRYLHTTGDAFHSLEVLDDWFVFMEILDGPFYEGKTQFADFSWKISPQ